MSTIVLSNGIKADIKVLPFEQAMALKNILLKSMSDSKMSLSMLKGTTLSTNITMELIEPLLNSVMYVDSSPEFNKIVMECLGRCLYDGKKITQETFESIEARENYYSIVIELIKVNVIPFFKGLASRLQALFSAQVPSIQK